MGGQFGDPLSLRDDYWAALALISAGQRESKHIKESVRFILKHQNRDGSSGASMTGIEICPDNTAAAILVLMAAGQKADSKAITRGLHYPRKAQNQDGGFSYLFVPSNAATDSRSSRQSGQRSKTRGTGDGKVRMYLRIFSDSSRLEAPSNGPGSRAAVHL